MSGVLLELSLADEQATTRLGADLAAALRVGDVLLLRGDLGAGKTTLARGLVRALAEDPAMDVPSPTFTLVQTYDTPVTVHHFDLYRMAAPDELEELGFDEAAARGAVLVEWPERAQGRLPGNAVTVELADEGAGRVARISGPDEVMARIERSLAARAFLDGAGWAGAVRNRFMGDASARSYELASLPGRPVRILMNSPRLVLGAPVRAGKAYAEIAHTAQTVAAFVGVGNALARAGVAVPAIHAQDIDEGFLLIEHLGAGRFLGPSGEPLVERYEAAGRLLAHIHGQVWPDRAEVAPGVEHRIPPFDRDAMMIEVELLLDWYLPFVSGRPATDADRSDFRGAWNTVLDRLSGGETSIVLRDVHSPNLIWREERAGLDRLGVIDFQDAMIGPSAYDVASLALDARVTVPEAIERATVAAYATARAEAGGFDRTAFGAAYAIMGAQRNSKILGIFVRLKERDGKPHYLAHLPRIRAYLRRVLVHPALAEVADFYRHLALLDEEPS